MNKKEYMERLWMGLDDMDEAAAQEIVQDFESHFDQAVREGRSEEEICEELGSPDELIRELRGAGRESGHAPGQEHTQTAETNGITSVIVEAGTADVHVSVSKTREIDANLYDRRNPLRVNNYELECTQHHDVYQIRVRPLERRWLRLGSNEDLHLDLSLPTGLDKLQLSTVSGDIKLDADLDIRGFDLNSTSGDIETRGLCCKAMKITSIAGDIQLQVQTEMLDLSSVSGDLEIETADTQLVRVNTISGEVNLSGEVRALLATTKSGDFEMRLIGCESLKAETLSGDLELTLPDCPGFECSVSGLSGDFRARMHGPVDRQGRTWIYGDGSCKMAFKTISGDINIRD